MSTPWIDSEHPATCSGWFASDGTTGDHICDCVPEDDPTVTDEPVEED